MNGSSIMLEIGCLMTGEVSLEAKSFEGSLAWPVVTQVCYSRMKTGAADVWRALAYTLVSQFSKYRSVRDSKVSRGVKRVTMT